jgi:phospholipase/carboxylesterase
MIRGVYGPDVRFIDRVLAETLGPTSAIVVDPSRFAIGGFSDGASYALSLGLTNGDVFSHVLAFSPGFMRPTAIHGAPEVFISHGDTDRVLNIDRCSRRLVQELRRINKSAALQYLEFKGGHTIPEAVARAAFERFLGAGDKTIEAEVEDSTVPAEESGVELT